MSARVVGMRQTRAKASMERGRMDAIGSSGRGFNAGIIAVAVIIAAVVSGVLMAPDAEGIGAFLALMVASAAAGGFVGFLVGAPGLAAGDDSTDKANEKGWANRLGVFGNWITGAAFVLAIANAAEIADWFSDVTRTVAENGRSEPEVAFQYGLGAWMIAAAALSFTVGFMQMVTTGKRLIDAASDAKESAALAASAATIAAEAAKEAREAVQSLR